MRIFQIALGLIIVILFFSGIFGFGLNSVLKKGLVEINENVPLSIVVLFFVIWSLIQMIFFKDVAREYLGGIIVGLGIACLLTSSLGFGIIFYAASFISGNKKYDEQIPKNS